MGTQRDLTVLKESLYFRASDGEKGSELWVSDGTKTGTKLLKDISPGTGSSLPVSMRACTVAKPAAALSPCIRGTLLL